METTIRRYTNQHNIPIIYIARGDTELWMLNTGNITDGDCHIRILEAESDDPC